MLRPPFAHEASGILSARTVGPADSVRLRHHREPHLFTYPAGKETLYAYDAANRLASVTDRAGARTCYSYNALDLPTQVSAGRK